jgi:hypothetical protein
MVQGQPKTKIYAKDHVDGEPIGAFKGAVE